MQFEKSSVVPVLESVHCYQAQDTGHVPPLYREYGHRRLKPLLEESILKVIGRGIQTETLFSVALLSASSVRSLAEQGDIEDEEPVNIWKLDLQTRRQVIFEKLSKAMAEDEKCHGPTPANWSLENFIDKYLIDTKVHYRSPDNWTINNLLENNEHALFHPYFIEDYVKKYGIDVDDNEETKETNDTEKSWTFKDFVEKYEPRAIFEEIGEKLNGEPNLRNVQALLAIVNSLDPTDELLSLPVPPVSGRRWRFDSYTIPPPYKKLIGTGKDADDVNNLLLFMKQSIYEARNRMALMQNLREKYRTTALYKMGFLFAKTDYACKIFSSLAYKSFRMCSNIQQELYGQFRLYLHYLDIAYNIERLAAKWFDVDILKDMLWSNDIIGRNVVLGDRNLTSPEMAVAAFNEMFID